MKLFPGWIKKHTIFTILFFVSMFTVGAILNGLKGIATFGVTALLILGATESAVNFFKKGKDE